MADKILPHSIDTENALLGCLLVEPNLFSEIDHGLIPDDFYSTANRKIFAAIRKLYEAGAGIDLTTLSENLKSTNDFDKIGGTDYISDLITNAPFYHNVKEYAQIVMDKSLTRKLIKAGSDIVDSAYKEHDSVQDLIQVAESKVFNLSQGRSEESATVEISDIVLDTLKKIQLIHQNKGKLTGIPTGFRELDQRTSGLQDSDLIIIAARPSMGKTAFALNIAVHAAVREKKNVMIFSLEMSRDQLVQRMILSEALVDSNRVRTGELRGIDDWQPIMYSAGELSNSHVTINDTPGISLAEMRSVCRRKQIEEPIDLIVIDYMQLMQGSGRSENRQHEISEISRGLKQLAREMNCPVICLSQLARGPESRTDKRPMLSDLRDSGSIEQDADVVMFLYRDAYYNRDEAANPYEAELNIAKQRNGPTGKIDLRWIAEYTKFTDPANEAEENLEEETPF